MQVAPARGPHFSLVLVMVMVLALELAQGAGQWLRRHCAAASVQPRVLGCPQQERNLPPPATSNWSQAWQVQSLSSLSSLLPPFELRPAFVAPPPAAPGTARVGGLRGRRSAPDAACRARSLQCRTRKPDRHSRCAHMDRLVSCSGGRSGNGPWRRTCFPWGTEAEPQTRQPPRHR